MHALQGQAQLSSGGKPQELDSVWCTPDDDGADWGAVPGEEGGERGQGTLTEVSVEAGLVSPAAGGRGGSVDGDVLYGQLPVRRGTDAKGGWLSGSAVRAQSARLRQAGVGAGVVGADTWRPASAAVQQRSALRPASAAVQHRPARPVSAAAAGVLRPASAAVHRHSARLASAAVSPASRPASACTVDLSASRPGRDRKSVV